MAYFCKQFSDFGLFLSVIVDLNVSLINFGVCMVLCMLLGFSSQCVAACFINNFGFP